jgi:heptosyltransferase-2/heptosyltransferase-3
MNLNDLASIHPQRILVCQLRQIGDVILTSHIPQLLKKRFPDAAIDFFTEKKCAPILENNPYIAEIKILDKSRLTHFGKELAAYWNIARNNYDMVIDFQQLPRCRFVVLFSQAPVRLTLSPPWYNRWLYSHWVNPGNDHPVIRKAKILSPLGVRWKGEMPNLYLTRQETEWAQSWLLEHGIHKPDDMPVSVAPTHRCPTRRWPSGYYGELIRLAVQKNSRLKFILFHGPGERACVEKVRDVARCPQNCILPDSMLSIRQMAAIMANIHMHIGNCSAPRHCALAVDTPSLTIVGSAGSGWTFPSPKHVHISQGLSCQPCKQSSCRLGNIACMKKLSPSKVLDEFWVHLDATKS